MTEREKKLEMLKMLKERMEVLESVKNLETAKDVCREEILKTYEELDQLDKVQDLEMAQQRQSMYDYSAADGMSGDQI